MYTPPFSPPDPLSTLPSTPSVEEESERNIEEARRFCYQVAEEFTQGDPLTMKSKILKSKIDNLAHQIAFIEVIEEDPRLIKLMIEKFHLTIRVRFCQGNVAFVMLQEQLEECDGPIAVRALRKRAARFVDSYHTLITHRLAINDCDAKFETYRRETAVPAVEGRDGLQRLTEVEALEEEAADYRLAEHQKLWLESMLKWLQSFGKGKGILPGQSWPSTWNRILAVGEIEAVIENTGGRKLLGSVDPAVA